MNTSNKPILLIVKSFSSDSLDYIHKELDPYFNVVIPDSFAEASLRGYIKDAEYILGHHISDSLLSLSGNLKYFQCISSGLDHLNLDLFRRLNIEVVNSTSHARHVAKFALALMLNIACKISLNDFLLRKSTFNHLLTSDQFSRLSPCFFNESVGLIGYGAINKTIEQLLAPFEPQTFYYRKSKDSSSSSLDQIFSVCKYIFIAIPLNEQTNNLIGDDLLLKNPISPYIVNVGRAEVIDRNALIKALETMTISGFASDVPYGPDSSSPLGFDGLFQFPNVILSPHRAASTIGIPSYLPGAVSNLIKLSNCHLQQ